MINEGKHPQMAFIQVREILLNITQRNSVNNGISFKHIMASEWEELRVMIDIPSGKLT
jgi:hypothetical protein